MADSHQYSVLIYWQDVRKAIELLQQDARGGYHFRPVGNRVVVDCTSALDAEKLCAAFPGSSIARNPV